MRHFVKPLLVALLCLALPMQGVVAAATLYCGHSHHGDSVMSATGGAGGAGDAGIEAPPDSTVIERSDYSGNIHCNACAACCSGALIAPPNRHTLAPLCGFSGIPFPPLAVSSTVPGTLDRPPPSTSL